MFLELFLLRKISEFPKGARTHNLQIAGETLYTEPVTKNATGRPVVLSDTFISLQ